MKTILTLLLTGCLAIALVAAQSRSAADQYQEALRLEEVKGDLKGAIELYKKLAQGSDRAIAAKALIQMATCYEKLGHPEAHKAYERVVREFKDQAETAATARARLAAIPDGSIGRTDISFRRVWNGSQNQAPAVSYDGRYIAYQFGAGSINVRELATRQDRTLIPPQPSRQDAEDPAISRDGRMVAYTWFTGGRYELRTVAVQAASPSQPRRLFRTDDVAEPTPFDWSPDGRTIAVHLLRDDRTSQIGLISTVDGSLKVLKSMDWYEYKKRTNRWSVMSFSPDGKYLAYDLAADRKSGQRDVFVVAVDGGQEIAVIAHPSDDLLAAWSPDGQHLLFLSDRTGSMGLWSQPMVDGRPQGPAALIKTDLGAARSMGITASGALHFFQRSGSVDEVWVLENFLPRAVKR